MPARPGVCMLGDSRRPAVEMGVYWYQYTNWHETRYQTLFHKHKAKK